jgi:hypothetical protein
MLIRIVAASIAGFLLVGCDDNGKDQSKQVGNICKGLSQTDCAAKSECEWNADKKKCRRKKAEDAKPSPQTDQNPPAETTTPQ